jgi:hypothetical protein
VGVSLSDVEQPLYALRALPHDAALVEPALEGADVERLGLIAAVHQHDIGEALALKSGDQCGVLRRQVGRRPSAETGRSAEMAQHLEPALATPSAIIAETWSAVSVNFMVAVLSVRWSALTRPVRKNSLVATVQPCRFADCAASERDRLGDLGPHYADWVRYIPVGPRIWPRDGLQEFFLSPESPFHHHHKKTRLVLPFAIRLNSTSIGRLRIRVRVGGAGYPLRPLAHGNHRQAEFRA